MSDDGGSWAGYWIALALLLASGVPGRAVGWGIGVVGLALSLLLLQNRIHTPQAIAAVGLGLLAYAACFVFLLPRSSLFVSGLVAAPIALAVGSVAWLLAAHLRWRDRRTRTRSDAIAWFFAGVLFGFSFLTSASIGFALYPIDLAIVAILVGRRRRGRANERSRGLFAAGAGVLLLPFAVSFLAPQCDSGGGWCSATTGRCVEYCAHESGPGLFGYLFVAISVAALVGGLLHWRKARRYFPASAGAGAG